MSGQRHNRDRQTRMTNLGKHSRRLDAALCHDTGTTIGTSDEAFELLLKNCDHDTGEGDLGTRSYRLSSLHKNHSGSLYLIGSLCTLLFVVTVLLDARAKLFSSQMTVFHQGSAATIEEDSGPNKLGIQLHPENHENREPQTISHSWEITSDFRFPDGVKKKVYLVNGVFPGPTIECRSGDRLIINVTNSLHSGEGVSIHWHGLEMRDYNSMDGASAFTQCAILPGNSFVYDFQVGEEQSGTFWWHGHSQVQRGDGLFGGLVVHKPKVEASDSQVYSYQDDILVMIGDWYHRSAEEVLSWYTSVRGFGNEPVPDSLLVNGLGRFICSMAVPARPLECIDTAEDQLIGLLGLPNSSTTRLRIVNTGSLAGFTLQVSSAKVTPVTVDGGFPISGSTADTVGILYPGERVDLVLHLEQSLTSSSPKLEISLDPENFRYPNTALRQNQSFPLFTSSTKTVLQPNFEDSLHHIDLSTVSSATKSQIPQHADHTIILYAKTQKLSIDNDRPTGYVNRTSWSPQSSPPYPLLSLPRSQWDVNQFVPYVPTSQNSQPWVDIVINNLDDGAHPFHLHGYSFYVLASYRSEHGWGSYNPASGVGIGPAVNLLNPVRKDTVSVPRRGYVVVRFKADNEGIWMLHCHVLFHQASGMAMGIHVGNDESHGSFDSKARGLCPDLPRASIAGTS